MRQELRSSATLQWFRWIYAVWEQGVQMCLWNAFSVDSMNHPWEREFVYCLVDTLCALRLETKSPYFVQEFDTTDFYEHNKKQSE